MIKSMTGYGCADDTVLSKRFTVEIKSVNHRYSDINVKVPRSYTFLEELIKKCVARYITRGKCDVYLSVEAIEGAQGEVSVNSALAKSYYDALLDLKEQLSLKDEIKIENLTRFQDIFNVVKVEEDNDAIAEAVIKIAEKAGENFNKMRQIEGEKLYDDLSGGLSELSSHVDDIKERSPQIVKEYSERLREKMHDILGNYPVDEGRLLNEVAVFSDKVDINEELVRMKSHIAQMSGLIKSDVPVGKKLDFIIQEMNREANTMGSKSSDLDALKTVIEMKSCIEKLREQVQNVE